MSLATPLLPTTTPEPSPSPTVPSPSDLVNQIIEPTANETWTDWLVGTPLRILLILVFGFILLAIVRRAVRMVTERIGRPQKGEIGGLLRITPLATERRAGRARTLGSVLRSTANILVGSLMALMILDQLGINLAPLLASAGVAGVALGFGAQSLVKDFLSGTFLLLEDQYGVGDLVDFGTVVGTVEAVALRVTKVRDGDGTLWYLRNGEIVSTGNRTQGWGMATVDIRVGYTEDVAQVLSLLAQAGAEVQSDSDLNPVLLAAPSVIGPQDLEADSLHFLLTAKTKQGSQDAVARALRVQALQALSDAGIALARVPWNPAS